MPNWLVQRELVGVWISEPSSIVIVCVVALVSCAWTLERVVACKRAKGRLLVSRALVVVVVVRSRITTERSVLVSITGDNNAGANSDVGCVVFSNA